MTEQEEIRAVYEQVRDAKWFRYALSCRLLFQYLWKHRGKPSSTKELWDEALGQKGDFDYSPGNANTVRDRCRALRAALKDYAKEVRSGWIFDLPLASETDGYQLRWYRRADPLSATRSFWEPHLSSSRIYVTYPELLFYQDWSKHFTFRYFHLNSEDLTLALAELKKQHRQMYSNHLIASYPYVTSGDIEARDLITDWFAENAMVKILHAVARQKIEKIVAESSLILLGSAATNGLIGDFLSHSRSHPLAFHLQAGGITVKRRRYHRVIVKGKPAKPTAEEMQRLAPYKPVRVGSDYHIDFSPEKGAELGILSRIPNPHGGAAVTIFNAESGRMVYQMARLVTEEARFRKAINAYDAAQSLQEHAPWPNPMPKCFEILYAMHSGSISTDHREASLEPLAWRLY